jgi:hypothetical protein
MILGVWFPEFEDIILIILSQVNLLVDDYYSVKDLALAGIHNKYNRGII